MKGMKRFPAFLVSGMFALPLAVAGCEKKSTKKPIGQGGATTEAQAKEKPKEPLTKKQKIAD